MLERRSRRVLVAAILSVLPVLSACGSGERAGLAVPASPSPTKPPLSAGPPGEAELEPGWDESPDGPAPTPDAQLSGTALTALLRTRSSTTDSAESCEPKDVTARLSGVDAALGHRYTTLIVRNTSSRTCVVEGVPGIGARGDWGHRLTLTIERATSASGTSGLVRLAPGAEAQALVEWTGELAGHDAERASLVVIQLASGQVPVRLPARITDAPAGADDLDVGMLTTLRLAAFEHRD